MTALCNVGTVLFDLEEIPVILRDLRVVIPPPEEPESDTETVIESSGPRRQGPVSSFTRAAHSQLKNWDLGLRGCNPPRGPGSSCDSRLVTGPVVAFQSIKNGAQVIYQVSPMMFGQYCLAPAKSLGKKLENLRNDPNLIDVGPVAKTRKLQQDESLTPFMFQSV